MPTTPADLGLRESARLIARRKLAPGELLEAVLDRIDRKNPELNAYLAVTAGTARDAAARAERRLAGRRGALPPLLGLPLSLKDLILSTDAPTTAGSRLFGEGLPPERDAPVVKRLRRAGALIVGKTNLHEVAYGVTTVNEHFGPARNPWDPTRVSGGSSGGSAVAVAAGMGAGSLGSDTRGSIRIPAACCGITGLKPTFGLVPTDDVVPLAPTLDHVGPMTRSVEDAALLLGAMVGSRAARERYLRAVDRTPRRLKIGLASYYFDDAQPEVLDAIEAAVKVCQRLKWEIYELEIPALENALEASRVIVSAEALAFHDRTLRASPDAYGPLVRSRLEGGRSLSAVDLVRAEQERVLLTEAFAEAFENVDLLLAPTLPCTATPIGTNALDIGGTERSISEVYCQYNAPQNVTGVPAMSLPGKPAKSGLPIGIQLIGGWRRETDLFAAGAAIQRESDWHSRRPR
ncbi:MAG: amidase [Gemmatimonadales bacterium]